MADEITVSAGLNIRKGNLQFQSQPSTFRATLAGSKAPGPDGMTASVGGTDISLAHLAGGVPGWCWLQNLDPVNDVTLGRWDPVTNLFYPLARYKPGEAYPIRLSRDVQDEYIGTSTTPTGTNSTLRIKASNAPCNVRVLIFED